MHKQDDDCCIFGYMHKQDDEHCTGLTHPVVIMKIRFPAPQVLHTFLHVTLICRQASRFALRSTAAPLLHLFPMTISLKTENVYCPVQNLIKNIHHTSICKKLYLYIYIHIYKYSYSYTLRTTQCSHLLFCCQTARGVRWAFSTSHLLLSSFSSPCLFTNPRLFTKQRCPVTGVV